MAGLRRLDTKPQAGRYASRIGASFKVPNWRCVGNLERLGSLNAPLLACSKWVAKTLRGPSLHLCLR